MARSNSSEPKQECLMGLYRWFWNGPSCDQCLWYIDCLRLLSNHEGHYVTVGDGRGEPLVIARYCRRCVGFRDSSAVQQVYLVTSWRLNNRRLPPRPCNGVSVATPMEPKIFGARLPKYHCSLTRIPECSLTANGLSSISSFSIAGEFAG